MKTKIKKILKNVGLGFLVISPIVAISATSSLYHKSISTSSSINVDNNSNINLDNNITNATSLLSDKTTLGYLPTQIDSSITLNNLNDIIPSDLQTMPSSVKELIINELINSNAIKNMNPNIVDINEIKNDIKVSYINGTAKNLEGSAQFNILLINNLCIDQNGNPIKSYQFKNITINGFRKLKVANIPSDLVSQYLNKNYMVDFILQPENIEPIKQKSINSIVEYCNNNNDMFLMPTSNEDIELKFYKNTETSLSVDVSVKNNIIVDREGNIEKTTFYDTFTFFNFSDGKTTVVNEPVIIDAFKDYYAYEPTTDNDFKYNVIVATINDFIANNPQKVFLYLNPQQDINNWNKDSFWLSGFGNADLDYNNKEGWFAIPQFSVHKEWVIEDGVQVKDSKNFKDTKIYGFKKLTDVTTINQQDEYSIDISNTKFANLFTGQCDEREIEQYINDNKDELIKKFYKFVPDGAYFLFNDFNYKTLSTSGQITLKLKLNKIYKEICVNGFVGNDIRIVEPSWDDPTVITLTIKGFKPITNDGLTTIIPNPITIKGYEDYLPQNYNHWPTTNDIIAKIKDELAKTIQFPAYGKEITPGEIQVHWWAEHSPNNRAYNNALGCVYAYVEINGDRAWKDGVPYSVDEIIQVNGFKKIPPTEIINTNLSVNGWIDNNFSDWQTIKANEFSLDQIRKFLNEHKVGTNGIFNSIPDDTTISIIDDPIYDDINGTISLKINVNKIYNELGDSIDYSYSEPISITINGFMNVNTNPDAYTTFIEGGLLNNVSSILPDQVNNSNQVYLSKIKKAIINDNKIKNPIQGHIFSENDINIDNFKPHNKDGSLTCTVYITNGAQNKAVFDPNFSQEVTFTGFNTQQPTTKIDNVSLQIPGMSSTLPYYANENDLLNFLNQNKKELYKDFPLDSNIKIISINKNDSQLSSEGKLSVGVSISPIYDENGNLSNNSIDNQIIISGFKPSVGVNTTFNTNELTISSLNQIKPYEAVNNRINETKSIIINYLINNLNVFENLVQNINLTDTDITIGSLTNPSGIDGSIVANNITIKNKKGMQNGIPVDSLNLGSLTIKGFLKQQPTSFINQSQVPLILDAFKNIQTLNANSITLLPIIKENLSYFIKNCPDDASINIEVYQNTMSLTQGTVDVNISINKYYDQKGNLKEENLNQIYTLGGFIKNTNSTSVADISLPSQYKDQIATDVVNNNKNEFIKSIKNEIMNNNLINNYYPLNGPLNDQFSIEIVESSINNLNGALELKIILNDGYYMENGVVITPSKPLFKTISGFRKLIPLTIDDSVINNEQIINKNLNINEIINNPQTKMNMIDAIYNNISDDMFASGKKPTKDKILITFDQKNPANGSFNVNIKIDSPYIDHNGNINDGPFTKSINISNCKHDTSTTIINDGIISGCNDIIATDLNNNISIEIKNKIKQAILDSNLIQNTTNGMIPNFSINNFDIVFLNQTANNANGSINVNITIKNSYACENGNMLETKVFKNIHISGFKCLKPTIISEDVINSAINKDWNTNIIFANKDSVIEKIKDAIYNSFSVEMFPSGNIPDKNNIQITLENPLPSVGTFKVNVILKTPIVENDAHCTINNDGLNQSFTIKCAIDNTTTIAVDGTLNIFNNIIPTDININDQTFINQLKNEIINNHLIQNISSTKKEITTNDFDINIIQPTGKNNLNGSIQVNITLKSGFASKNGVIQNEPVTLNTINIYGFKDFVPTNISQSDLQNQNWNSLTVNEFLWNPDVNSEIINQIIKNINNKMFVDYKKPQMNQVKVEIISTDPSIGEIHLKITLNVNQYIDSDGNIQNGPYVQNDLILNGFKPDNTSTYILTNKALRGVENLIPTEININDFNTQQYLKQILIDNNVIQNTNIMKESITINDIDITLSDNHPSGNDNLNGTLWLNITIKNYFACNNGKPIENKTIYNCCFSGFKKIKATSLPQISLGDNYLKTVDQIINENKYNQIIKNQILYDPDISQKYPNQIPSEKDIYIRVIDKNVDQGNFTVEILVNKDYVDENGNIIKNKPFTTQLTFSGFQKPDMINNVWITVGSVAGAAAFIIITLIIVKICFGIYIKHKSV